MIVTATTKIVAISFAFSIEFSKSPKKKSAILCNLSESARIRDMTTAIKNERSFFRMNESMKSVSTITHMQNIDTSITHMSSGTGSLSDIPKIILIGLLTDSGRSMGLASLVFAPIPKRPSFVASSAAVLAFFVIPFTFSTPSSAIGKSGESFVSGSSCDSLSPAAHAKGTDTVSYTHLTLPTK